MGSAVQTSIEEASHFVSPLWYSQFDTVHLIPSIGLSVLQAHDIIKNILSWFALRNAR